MVKLVIYPHNIFQSNYFIWQPNPSEPPPLTLIIDPFLGYF